MAETHTHKDLALLCGVSETTIKSYRRKFPAFFPLHSRGKPLRFKAQAAAVALRIRELFQQHLSVPEIRKRLKAEFTEYQENERASISADTSGQFSGENLDKLLTTAKRMMDGMAALATAQARSEQRLAKLEDALAKLVQAEAGRGQSDADREAGAEKAAGAERRVTARKIVTVQGREGGAESYSLEGGPQPEAATEAAAEADAAPQWGQGPTAPPEEDLDEPVAIQSERGEYLGVPGRMTLGEFAATLERECRAAGACVSSWQHTGEDWVLTLAQGHSGRNDLWFTRTRTPRGNVVMLLHRMQVDGQEASQAFLLEYFRQVKGQARD